MKGNENNIKKILVEMTKMNETVPFFLHFYTIENVNPRKYIKESE